MPTPVSIAIALLCALAISACGGSSSRGVAKTSANPAPNDAAPPKTVTSRRLQPSAPGGLNPGTPVNSGFTGIQVFANHHIGFALTDLPQAGGSTYPVATADGGKTWRTDGPVLHIPAAQGPVAVGQAGVVGPHIYFAWCGACNTVIDVTPTPASTGGRHSCPATCSPSSGAATSTSDSPRSSRAPPAPPRATALRSGSTCRPTAAAGPTSTA